MRGVETFATARLRAARLRFECLVSLTLPTNRASRRVMEKRGLRFEGGIVHADLPHVHNRLAISDRPVE